MPFKTLGLHPLVVQACREMRYTEPTPVQAEAIPAILAGRDLIATAQTVTGVESVNLKKFQRQGTNSDVALLAGKLTLGRLEIARLDNDPNFPERGVFTLERG